MKELTPGTVSESIARGNRQEFEAARELFTFPPGNFAFDQAPQLAYPLMIDGHGATIRNAFKHDSHPLNSTLFGYGSGAGWVDRMVSSGPNLLLENPAAAANYLPGRTVYCFRYFDGSEPPQGLCQRRFVVSVSGSSIRLDNAVDARCNAAAWLANSTFTIDTVKRGDSELFVLNPKLLHAGQFVWLTSGPSVANESRGEFLQIESLAGRQVKFTRGATRDYTQATVALLGAVENITVKNLRLAESPASGGTCLFLKFARGLRFEKCTFDGPIGLNGCTDIEFEDCTFRGVVALNTTTRVRFSGCISWGDGIYTEESDAETVIEDCIILNAREHAIRTGFDPMRMTVRNLSIVRPAARAFACSGLDNRFERVTVRGETQESMFGGDRCSISDCEFSGNVIVYHGDDQSLRNVSCNDLHLGWVNGSPSNGRAGDVRASRIVTQPTGHGWTVNT